MAMSSLKNPKKQDKNQVFEKPILLNKKSNFELAHLLGSDEAKIRAYGHHKCPREIIEEAMQTDKEGVLKAIASNYSIDIEQVKKIFIKGSNILGELEKNIANPECQKKIINESLKMIRECENNIKIVGLAENLFNGAIVSGGYLAHLIGKEIGSDIQFSDIDFYFHDRTLLENTINKILINSEFDEEIILDSENNELFLKNVETYKKGKLKNSNYNVICTKNAITLTENNLPSATYQFILKSHNAPDTIVSWFDFSHTKNYILLKNQHFSFDPESVASIKEKKLIFKGGINPISSFFRMNKFVKRGWRISHLEVIKMVANLQKKVDFNKSESFIKYLEGFYFHYTYPDLMKNKMTKIQNIDELLDLLEKESYF